MYKAKTDSKKPTALTYPLSDYYLVWEHVRSSKNNLYKWKLHNLPFLVDKEIFGTHLRQAGPLCPHLCMVHSLSWIRPHARGHLFQEAFQITLSKGTVFSSMLQPPVITNYVLYCLSPPPLWALWGYRLCYFALSWLRTVLCFHLQQTFTERITTLFT